MIWVGKTGNVLVNDFFDLTLLIFKQISGIPKGTCKSPERQQYPINFHLCLSQLKTITVFIIVFIMYYVICIIQETTGQACVRVLKFWPIKVLLPCRPCCINLKQGNFVEDPSWIMFANNGPNTEQDWYTTQDYCQ